MSVLKVNLMIEAVDERLEDLSVNVAHLVLLLCILSYLCNPCPARLDIVLPDTCIIFIGNLRDAVVF